jgi:hypothetical protein
MKQKERKKEEQTLNTEREDETQRKKEEEQTQSIERKDEKSIKEMENNEKGSKDENCLNYIVILSCIVVAGFAVLFRWKINN